MPEMRAPRIDASVGGKTRFSIRIDSMALMLLSPDGVGRWRANVSRTTYRPLTAASLQVTVNPRACHGAKLQCRPAFRITQKTSLPQNNPLRSGPLRPLPNLIFASRWLQLPLYLGLIAAQAVYVFHFWVELA